MVLNWRNEKNSKLNPLFNSSITYISVEGYPSLKLEGRSLSLRL